MWAKELTGSNGIAGSVFAVLGRAEPARAARRRPHRPVPPPHRDDRHRPRDRRRRAAAAVRRRPGGPLAALRRRVLLRRLAGRVLQRPVGAAAHDARRTSSSARPTARWAPSARRCGWSAPLAGAALYAGFGGPAVAILDAATLPASRPPRCSRCGSTSPRRAGPSCTSSARPAAGGRHLLGNPVLRATVVATVICMLAHRHQRVGVLRHRRRGARQAGRVRRRARRRSRASARSSAGVTITALIRRTGELRPVALGVRACRRRCRCSSTSSIAAGRRPPACCSSAPGCRC